MLAVAPLVAGLMLAAGQAPAADLAGPATICFRYSSFRLVAGERLEHVSMGIHGLRAGITGLRGGYEVLEGEIMRAFSEDDRVRVLRTGGFSIYRSGSPPSYAVMTRPAFSPDRDVMLVALAGAALDGSEEDAEIYSRVAVGDPATVQCDRRYLYGWDLMLGLEE